MTYFHHHLNIISNEYIKILSPNANLANILDINFHSHHKHMTLSKCPKSNLPNPRAATSVASRIGVFPLRNSEKFTKNSETDMKRNEKKKNDKYRSSFLLYKIVRNNRFFLQSEAKEKLKG